MQDTVRERILIVAAQAKAALREQVPQISAEKVESICGMLDSNVNLIIGAFGPDDIPVSRVTLMRVLQMCIDKGFLNPDDLKPDNTIN